MRAKHGKYYTTEQIDKTGAQYRIVFSERSDGKTYAVLMVALRNFVKTGKQLAYIRRWNDDLVGKRGRTLFDNLVTNGEISKATHGEWTDVIYKSNMWYLSRTENNQRVVMEKPIGYGFAINAMTHDKSSSFPNVTTILFECTCQIRTLFR